MMQTIQTKNSLVKGNGKSNVYWMDVIEEDVEQEGQGTDFKKYNRGSSLLYKNCIKSPSIADSKSLSEASIAFGES